MSKPGGRLRGSYVSFVLIYFFFYFAMSAFSSVLSVYLGRLGFSSAELSRIVSSANLFSFAVMPISGYITDLTGRPRLVSGGMLLVAGALAAVFAYVRSAWLLFALNGVVMSFISSTMPITERLASSSRFRYGILRVWGTLGYAAGAQVAGLALGTSPVMLFFMVAAACGLSILGLIVSRDSASPFGAVQTAEQGERVRLTSFLKNRQYLLFLVTAMLFAACSYTNMTFAPVLLSGLGVADGFVGTVISLGTLVEIPLIVFSNKFMDPFTGKQLFRAMAVIAITQYLIYGLCVNAVIVIVAMILLKSVASTMFSMLLLKLVRNLVDGSMTSTGLAIASTVNSIGSICMQNLGGLLVDARGIQVFYLTMAGVVFASLLLTAGLRVQNTESVFS